ncbi:hypothetical protein EV178_004224 [Coemansia sp. RSA 1646]|nr:hypothetical protein EV178_004224 [Coemansia sp. RSA 1646]KAJ2213247.1 hypothetical protein EV179_004034 [Coemansia sp. RSA 487]
MASLTPPAQGEPRSETSQSPEGSKLQSKNNDGDDDDDDDDDEWDKRIQRTGCFEENERLLVCHADTGDWRKCAKEMLAFKECMKQHGRFQDNN